MSKRYMHISGSHWDFENWSPKDICGKKKESHNVILKKFSEKQESPAQKQE